MKAHETRSHARAQAAGEDQDVKLGSKKKGGADAEQHQQHQNKRSKSRSSAEIAAEFDEFCKAARRHLSVDQMRKILEASDHDPSGSDDAVVPRCEDVMFYGPLKRCPLCNGWMECTGKEYKCRGAYSEWGSCIFTTKEDQRKPEPLKLPDGIELNSTAKEWFDKQDPSRRPPRELAEIKPFEGMTISLSGRLTRKHDIWRREIEKNGGKVAKTVKGVSCLVVAPSERERGGSGAIAEALEIGVPVVSEGWLYDCIEKKETLPMNAYDVVTDLVPEGRGIPMHRQDSSEEALESLATELKVYGKLGVHRDTKLQERGGQILEKDGIKFNCGLTLCDIGRDMNEYCIMQLIMVPKSELYLYYKRGRPGDDPNAEERLEERTTIYSRRKGVSNIDEAIRDFASLFKDLTGNEFEPWEREKNIKKVFHKFFPMDVDDGIDARYGGLGLRQLGVATAHSKLDPHVASLLKVLCSQHVYKYALVEMGYDIADVPTGMLTDIHLHRCEETLLGFLGQIRNSGSEGEKMRLWAEFSNKWFTLMPSTRPFIMRNFDEVADFGAAALETVRDIKVASLIIGDMTGATVDDPLNDRFLKLGCSIDTLDKQSEDFKMIAKYLETTYEPVRLEEVEYGVTIDNIFQVESSACPSLEDLKNKPNKVLLWCGTRTSNLLRHLQKGFLPAVCSIPVPGYMFGNAIVCSDASAEAARYGFTAVDRPEGFMVLAVVSLGDKVIESESLPEDTESLREKKAGVKILGRKKPDESGHFRWREDVLVPCGRLISSGKDKSPLEYNEYGVYDPKQASIRYLVAVKFEEMNVEMVPEE